MLYVYFDHPAFRELAIEIQYAFESQGYEVKLTSEVDANNFLDLYLVFGMNDFQSSIVPRNYIIIQLEQTTGNDQSNWFSETYLRHLRKALMVWDYSLVNYQNLKKMGIKNLEYVPIQYLTKAKVNKSEEKDVNRGMDIDILFLGSLNERRQSILSQLKEQLPTKNIVIKSNVWGEERDDLIRRAKVVINIHYYEHSILETTRLSFLLSNGVYVISEVSNDPVLDRWHQPYCQLVPYGELVSSCCRYFENEPKMSSLALYQKQPYANKIPIDKVVGTYSYLISKRPMNLEALVDDKGSDFDVDVPDFVMDDSDLFEAQTDVTKDGEFVLKLPKLTDDDLPFVSIITPTYNRKAIFPMAIRNWNLFKYPREKLEWIIVDDSDNNDRLSDLLPKSPQIKYFKLTTTGRLTIGQKRNFGIKQASHEIICFVDDDDYYSPHSLYSRVTLLLKYPKYDVVGVSQLDIYDVVNDFSAKITGRPFVSEASMAFRKSFWLERQFPEESCRLGEGHIFLKGRRDRVIKMPSCFNLIAFTHWQNMTITRSHDMFKHVEKKGNILKTLDTSTRLFIFNLFDKAKPKAIENN